MEAWIKVYNDLGDHPKVYTLAEKLRIEQYAAVGLVVCLWIWALIHAPDGDLRRFPDTAIARACHWNKPAAGLVKALTESGFLDDRQIHDWDEYAGLLAESVRLRKEKTRLRVEAYRARKAAAANALQETDGNDSVTRYTSVTDIEASALRNAAVTESNAPRTRTITSCIEDDKERAREEALHSYEHSEIGTLISTCLKAMTPRAWEELKVYMGEMPEDLIAWAVQTSCEHGGNNWAYVSAVLRGLQSAGIKTVEDAEKRSEEHRQKRSQRQQQTGKPSNIAQLNYSQREYPEQKPGELPDWYIRMLEDEQKAEAAKKAGVQREMPEWLAEMLIEEETQNEAD